MTSALGGSPAVIINRGSTPSLRCQRSNLWHKCDKDTRCCAAALTLCHFRGAASVVAPLFGWPASLFLDFFRFMYLLCPWDSERPWPWVQENMVTQTHTHNKTCFLSHWSTHTHSPNSQPVLNVWYNDPLNNDDGLVNLLIISEIHIIKKNKRSIKLLSPWQGFSGNDLINLFFGSDPGPFRKQHAFLNEYV